MRFHSPSSIVMKHHPSSSNIIYCALYLLISFDPSSSFIHQNPFCEPSWITINNELSIHEPSSNQQLTIVYHQFDIVNHYHIWLSTIHHHWPSTTMTVWPTISKPIIKYNYYSQLLTMIIHHHLSPNIIILYWPLWLSILIHLYYGVL